MDSRIYINDIVRECGGKILFGNPNTECQNFSKDTRTIKDGDVYIGIKGEKFDGNDFYQQAFELGASTCIIDRNYANSHKIENIPGKNLVVVKDTIRCIQMLASYKRSLVDIPVIAITGSVGKTSTKDLVAAVISQKYTVLKSSGNYNNSIGLPLTILGLKDEEVMVLEMGMNHEGEIRLLTNIAKPTIGIITNIGTAHIGNLGSRENILKAKLEIIEGLPYDGVLVINNDNDIMHSHLNEIKNKINVLTTGIKNESDILATNISNLVDGSSFSINDEMYKINVPGEAFVYNSLIAYAVGKKLNIDNASIKRGLASFKTEGSRLEKIDLKNNITLINDSYNASFDSVKNAIELLSKTNNNRKILLLGDILELGKYSKKIHQDIGKEILNSNIDIIITVGTESKATANILKPNGYNKNRLYSFEREDETYDLLNKLLKSGDIILIKGSNGMKLINIVNMLKDKYKQV